MTSTAGTSSVGSARVDAARPAAILSGQTDPVVARRAWPRWLAVGVVLLLAAVAAAVLSAGAGPRLLLGVLGAGAVVRGSVLAAGGEAPARRLGVWTALAGLVGLGLAAVPGPVAGWALLIATPLALASLALVLLLRGGRARRGGIAAGVWLLAVTALLVGVGLAGDWARARGGATLLAAFAVAVLGLACILGANGLRAAASRPLPPRPAGCGGCACGAGGCGTQEQVR